MSTPKQTHVISPKYLPPRLPWAMGIVLWLLLDRLQPPGYVWGIAWTVYGVWCALAIFAMFTLRYGAPRDIETRD